MPHVRPATPADEEFLIKLTSRLAAFPVPDWRTRDEIARADHQILLSALRAPADDSCILVVEAPPGSPAGTVFCTTRTDYFTGAPHAHVEVLAVEAGAEGQGLGRSLLQAAEVWARGRGYRHITLNVFAANGRARAVYERLGYAPETVHYLKPLASP